MPNFLNHFIHERANSYTQEFEIYINVYFDTSITNKRRGYL